MGWFFLFILFFIGRSWPICAMPVVADLTLEEKVGQLLIVHFHGEKANEEARVLIQDLHIGGIIYYNWANALSNPEQVCELSRGLQAMAKQTPHALPLFLVVDQEGGSVNRLKKGFTIFPSNFAMGIAGNEQWVEASAYATGQELKAVGITLNLAPVADVNTNPANPVIGIRSYGSEPSKVTCLARYALRGYRAAGLLAALKHFPGHGDASIDSHAALPTISKTRASLDRCELLPFRLLAGEADVIMTAHLKVPALDAEHCVTFSKNIVTGLLRNELKFEGVTITDSLAMEGILSQVSSLEEAVIKAIEAGHDLILIGGKQLLSSQRGLEFSTQDIRRVHRSLVEAIKSGKLSEKHIDQSVERILALKMKGHFFESSSIFAAEKNRALAQKIARHAVRIVKGTPQLPCKHVMVVAPESLREELEQTDWCKMGKMIYFDGPNPNPDSIETVTKEIMDDSTCFFLAYQAWKNPGQGELFDALRRVSSMLCALAVGNPLDSDSFSSADLVLCTYGPPACSLQAAYEEITK